MLQKFCYFLIGSIITYGCLFWNFSLMSSRPDNEASGHSRPSADFLSVPLPEDIPLILSASCSSSNLCNPSYLIDNDNIILQFETAAPCQPASGSFWYLFNPQNDNRHFTCIFLISHGLLSDQQVLLLTDLLYLLFPKYQYYGANPALTYFAPLTLSYSFFPLPNLISHYQLTLTPNHAAHLLSPQQVYTESGFYQEFSVIDAAGNGPCCIRIPLEDNAILLYNLIEPVVVPSCGTLTYDTNIWKEKPYAGESHRNSGRGSPRAD